MTAVEREDLEPSKPARLRTQWRLIQVALIFLTRVSIIVQGHISATDIARASRYYPIVGLLVGGCLGLIYLLTRQFFPPLLAATLTAVASAIITGAFHEDALGDVADAFGGGMTPERKLEIMRDSRLGTYGSFALFSALLIRIQCLAILDSGVIVSALCAIHAVSRWPMVWLLYRAPRARTEGLGAGTQNLTATEPMVSTVSTLAIAFLCLPPLSALVVMGACAAATLAVWHLASRHVGGITGDVLGSTQQIGELGALLMLVAVV
jgi:adenosylcobinamide-GDP ribazoletransferase